jgi:AcrR family transcriptional regulator
MVKPNGKNEETTRLKILSAARQEFIENGLRGARMQEIADRAGINKALLHYHFRDKENLYDAAVRSVADGVVVHLKQLFAEDMRFANASEMVEAMVRTYLNVLRKNPDLVGMAMREFSDGGKHLDSLMQGIAPLVKGISGGLVQGMKGKSASLDIPIPHIMINLMSMIWGTFLLQPMYQRILPVAGFKTKYDDAFYEMRVKSITQMVLQNVRMGGNS